MWEINSVSPKCNYYNLYVIGQFISEKHTCHVEFAKLSQIKLIPLNKELLATKD